MTMFRTVCTISLSILLLTACGKKEEATPPATTAPGAAGAGDAATQLEGLTAEGAGAAAREAMETFQTQYSAQLEEEASKVQALKAGAQAVADEQLSGLIASLDEKLAAARSKLGDMASADEGAASALKDEITALMNEIPALYEQAMARFEEVKDSMTPEIPGGGSLPGGG